MQDAPKAVWSIPYVSVAFFPSLNQNFIAYRSSKESDCIFEIHQLKQSGFSRVYSNCCCSCWFEPEIIKIGQLSHKMYSNNILYFQVSTSLLNAHTKKVWKFTSYEQTKHRSRNENDEILCDSEIQTDLLIPARQPYYYWLIRKKMCYLVNFCCSGKIKSENKRKRKDRQIFGPCRKIEKNLWNMRVTVIPVVISSLGSVPKNLEKRLEKQIRDLPDHC